MVNILIVTTTGVLMILSEREEERERKGGNSSFVAHDTAKCEDDDGQNASLITTGSVISSALRDHIPSRKLVK